MTYVFTWIYMSHPLSPRWMKILHIVSIHNLYWHTWTCLYTHIYILHALHKHMMWKFSHVTIPFRNFKSLLKTNQTTHLVNHRSPLVQLEEPLVVLASISICTMLYRCSNFDGSELYLVSSLCKINQRNICKWYKWKTRQLKYYAEWMSELA